MTTDKSRHVPSIVLSQDFWIGVQPTQPIKALTAEIAFNVMMMNQTTHLTQPSDNRSMVTANDVLLQAAAVTINVARIMVNMKGTPAGLSQGCLPNPLETETDRTAQSTM